MFRRGQAYLQLGQIDDAKVDFEKVRVFEPSQQTAVHEKVRKIIKIFPLLVILIFLVEFNFTI